MVSSLNFAKDWNQWFGKKGKKSFIYHKKHGEERKGKKTTTLLISRKEVREPSGSENPHRLELAKFRPWGYKGTSSKIISLFHKFLKSKLTINTSLDQRSRLVNTMVTLNWVRRVERTTWWRDTTSLRAGPQWNEREHGKWRELWEISLSEHSNLFCHPFYDTS